MTQKSRHELNREYGKRIVDQSLRVWSTLNKGVKRDTSMSSVVMRERSPSVAWQVLNSLVKVETSNLSKDSAKKNFESLGMIVGESAREYVARVKGLASEVRYDSVEATEEIYHRILTGLFPMLHFVREGFALRIGYTLLDLEQALINVELQKQPDGTDGHALTIGFKPQNN